MCKVFAVQISSVRLFILDSNSFSLRRNYFFLNLLIHYFIELPRTPLPGHYWGGGGGGEDNENMYIIYKVIHRKYAWDSENVPMTSGM